MGACTRLLIEGLCAHNSCCHTPPRDGEQELARLRAEVQDKDELLEATQKQLKHNAMHVDELMQASKEVSQRCVWHA